MFRGHVYAGITVVVLSRQRCTEVGNEVLHECVEVRDLHVADRIQSFPG